MFQFILLCCTLGKQGFTFFSMRWDASELVAGLLRTQNSICHKTLKETQQLLYESPHIVRQPFVKRNALPKDQRAKSELLNPFTSTNNVIVFTPLLYPSNKGVFFGCDGMLWYRPPADRSSAEGWIRKWPSYSRGSPDLTETGNRARKVSGTQGTSA